MAEDTDAVIRATGLKRTVARTVVASVLRRHPGHHSVGEIQAFIERDAPEAAGIARSSVYRALESLERAGLVDPVRTGQEEVQFEWGQAPHHHLVCDGCGHVHQVELDAVADIEDEARRTHGFTTRIRHLTLRGRCQSCSDAAGGEGDA